MNTENSITLRSMKALEVSIDGSAAGVFVPPERSPFAAPVGNIPLASMRGQIWPATDTENWQWQLPNISEGQTISFRMIEARRAQQFRPIAPIKG